MKKLLVLFVCIISFSSNAQTSAELLGKWQLVKWTDKGKEKDIKSSFKTDQVFQIFLPKGEFQSVVGEKINKGKWSLSNDNTELSITTTIVLVKFNIEYFDKEKRIISSKNFGTFEYKKSSE